MPGAALDSVDGDAFTGRVKVKLGPINLTYQGKASFIMKDEAAHRAVIDARGKDQRGNGTAAATVTATLRAEGAITRVDVLTDLNITGRPAQFGQGVMVDVGTKLLGQFADKLAAQLGSGGADRAGTAVAEPVEAPAAPIEGGPVGRGPVEAPRLRPVTEPEPIDLFEVAGGAAMARYATGAAGIAAVVLVVVLIVKRGRRSRG
jgi:carbon monoxide dehydrogenase subunit G